MTMGQMGFIKQEIVIIAYSHTVLCVRHCLAYIELFKPHHTLSCKYYFINEQTTEVKQLNS